MKKIFCILLVIVIFSCSDDSSDDSQSGNTISGYVYDKITGEPLSGVIVSFGDIVSVTGVSGNYILDLGQTSGVMTDTLYLYRINYCSFVFPGLEIDTGESYDYNFYMDVSGVTVAYTMKSIFGIIEYSNGTEIANTPDSEIYIAVYNSSKGWYSSNTNYDNGYEFETPTFGDDCLILVYVFDDDQPVMMAMERNVDLSGASPILNINFREPSETSVNVSGGSAGNYVNFYYDTPYGKASMADFPGYYTLTSAAESVYFINPFDYQGYWSQTGFVSETGYSKGIVSFSDTGPAGTSVVLPDIEDNGLNSNLNTASFTYNNGVIYMDLVSNATNYWLRIYDNPTENTFCVIVSSENTFELPEYISNYLSGRTCDVIAIPLHTNNEFISDYLEEFRSRSYTDNCIISHLLTADNDYIEISGVNF